MRVLLLSALLLPVAASPARADRVGAYGAMALRADLRDAAALLAAPDSTWTADERTLAARFDARFLRGEADPPPAGATPFVRDVLGAYHRYWRDAMRGAPADAAEARLLADVRTLRPPAGGGACGAEEDPLEWLRDALLRDGFHALTGRTQPLLDLMIWAREDTTRTPVALTDTTVTVEVVFVREFLASGWTAWATFGRSFTGGWAGPERLFCVADSYDPASESFRVGYLAHEGRHFADYPRFPALLQPDLEYRAKLTEVALADSTLRATLGHFASAAAFDEAAPHAWAAACVVRDLGAALGPGAPWPDLPADAIRAAARAALDAHTARLVAAGADTCRAVLGPPPAS